MACVAAAAVGALKRAPTNGRRTASDVLHGLVELHAAGARALDLTPANVLLTEQGGAVLANYGLVRHWPIIVLLASVV
jgi:hypothetical protein